MKLGLVTMAVAVVGLSTSAAQAQAQQAYPMNDGRTLTLARTIPGCQPFMVTQTTPGATILKADCRVPSQAGGQPDTDGQATLVIFTTAMATTPTSFINNVATSWRPDFPSLPADQRANVVSQTTKPSAAGALALRCAHRDNIEALNGEAICTPDTPTVTIGIAGLSTMALTADNVIDAVLAGVTVR